MKKRGVSLSKLSDIRRFMASVVNRLDRDEIQESKARTFGYLSSILRDVIKDCDLESRITELENNLKEKKNEQF